MNGQEIEIRIPASAASVGGEAIINATLGNEALETAKAYDALRGLVRERKPELSQMPAYCYAYMRLLQVDDRKRAARAKWALLSDTGYPEKSIDFDNAQSPKIDALEGIIGLLGERGCDVLILARLLDLSGLAKIERQKRKADYKPLDEAVKAGWLGIADYLLEKMDLREKVSYNPTTKGFDVYAEGRWMQDECALAKELFRKRLLPVFIERQRLLLDEAAQESVEDKRKRTPSEAMAKIYGVYIDALRKPSGIETLTDQLATMPNAIRTEAEFDAEPYVLNLRNGLYNLATGQFLANAIAQRRACRHQVAASYLEGASCPNWLQFLHKAIKREDSIRFVQKFLGCGLSGEMIELCMVFWGCGSNGKSTFVNAVREIMGTYTTAFKISAVMGDGKGNSDYELVKLKGVRLAFASESKQGAKLDEAILKAICSKDQLCARQIYEKACSFSPTHKNILLTNHLPKVEASDKGTWRRLALVKWEHNFDNDPDKRGDAEVSGIFRAERDGILQWMLEGWAAYRKEGLAIPKSIQGDTDEFRQDNDPLLAWVRSNYIPCETGSVPLKDVYMVYADQNQWSSIKSPKSLAAELRQRGYVVMEGGRNGVNLVYGIEAAPAVPSAAHASINPF